MGKILNLASLKAKANAAGVGTTATSTTPNLCPKKSAIAGYVTNGSSTVSISGTWADNLLVPEENVAVGKTIVSTYPRYRNVSVGNATNPDGDIPASGGMQRRALATVTYEWASVTVYSDNTETVGTWQSASSVIYGGYIPSSGGASSLGTTFKTRTSLGTSTPSGIVAGGTRTATGISIYQAANYITSITPTSSEGHDHHVSYSNIPASGGESTPTAWGRAIYTFSSGSTYSSGSTTPFTNVSATFSRSYPGFASNPNGNFSINGSTGKVTVGSYTGTTSRTAKITAILTVSITYTGSYAGVYTACPLGSVTHNPTCILDAYVPTTGFIAEVTVPSGRTSPYAWFYDTYTNGHYNLLAEAHPVVTPEPSVSTTATSRVYSSWTSLGYVDNVYIGGNNDHLGYVKIVIKSTGNIVLPKTAINDGNLPTRLNLTSTISTSQFNNGTKVILFIYSDS